ncbi:putative DNA helicase INO80 isoform X1 [Spodoptera litura]|uniref:DNA helicase INO80 isoform X1 n=1 Tax=Spodoptera litura TaxID=69820 RepID=A0A9J7EAJ7_SPOLT|nr:putative DNA helicase INO80 isoform X1 [Spodoptera litura]
MSDSETEISEEILQKEIADILDHASLENTSTKKVIQKLEKKLGVDLSSKKKMIDQIVMDIVNNMESEDEDMDESSDEEPKKKAPPKKVKKEEDDEDDEERDDSNDSDWGSAVGRLFMNSECSDDCSCTQQDSHIPSNIKRRVIRKHFTDQPRKAVILKRVAPNYSDDEAELFGKLTAKKLRKLPEHERDLMMLRINQMLLVKLYSINMHLDKATQTTPLPSPQFQTKKLYRVNAIPNINKPPNQTTASAPIPPANEPKPEVTTTKETPESSWTGRFCSIM